MGYFDAAAKVGKALAESLNKNVMGARCARAINDANVLCLGQLVTSPEDGNVLADAFLKQGFITQPMDSNGKPVEWWSGDVENFLKTSMAGIDNVEKEAKMVNKS